MRSSSPSNLFFSPNYFFDAIDHMACQNCVSTSCLAFMFKKTSVRFLKDFGPQCMNGKMYSSHLFLNRGGASGL